MEAMASSERNFAICPPADADQPDEKNRVRLDLSGFGCEGPKPWQYRIAWYNPGSSSG
jgi:hypothetical protein